jgi:hypothetical protein
MIERVAPYPVDTKPKGWRLQLDYERIEQSDTWALATAEIRPWLLMLWFTAWKQTPCGSLPDNDELIVARVGLAAEMFSKHRGILLRGWWRADDGRLYHDVIAEQVIGMLNCKLSEKQRKAAYRAKIAELEVTGKSGSVPGVSHGCPTGQTGQAPMSHGCPPAATPPEPEPEPEPIKGERGDQASPGHPSLVQPKKKTRSCSEITFNAWREQIKVTGEKAISDYQPVWDYAEKTGLPSDWINLAWITFKERYANDAGYQVKKYTDWRQVFLNAVKGNWFKLWFVKDNQFSLSTQGHQAELATREAV